MSPPCVLCGQPADPVGPHLKQRIVDDLGGDLCWPCGQRLFPEVAQIMLEAEQEYARRLASESNE